MNNSDNMEIERKFHPETLPFEPTAFPGKKITQAYIAVDPVIRIRQLGDEFILTIKSGGTMVHKEYELPLTEKQFDYLNTKTEPGSIEKTRYYIPLDGGLTAELDIFAGHLDGLIIVEVEFPSESAANAFIPPEWFSKEVTNDHRYTNNSLAHHGLPN